MVVDIVTRREPSHRVISKSYVGPYIGENMLRREFAALERWADKDGIKLLKWFVIEHDRYEVGKSSSQRRWSASIEFKGSLPTKPPKGIEIEELPAAFVASVAYDPEIVSSRLVYHGLECWLDWRTKFGEFEEAGPTREIYLGNPWTDKTAERHIEIQVPIKKMNRRKAS